MPPQQPYYQPKPAPGLEQYDFIMGGSGGPRGGFSASSDMKTRLIIVIGGAVVLLIAAFVFISILSRSSQLDPQPLITLAQQQTELSRISERPALQAKQQPTENLAANTWLSLLTEQRQVAKFLEKHGTKLDNKTLQATKNAKTDTELKTALTNGDYDQVYVSIAQAQLTTYARTLKQALQSATDPSERQLISTAYAHAQLLIEQSKVQ